MLLKLLKLSRSSSSFFFRHRGLREIIKSINGHIYRNTDDIFCSLNYNNENRWQSPEKATRDESRAQIRAGDWWRQEAAQIPPGDRRVERNPKVPKVHGIAHPKVAVSTLGERNRARFQD
jgi:hypothetical protein